MAKKKKKSCTFFVAPAATYILLLPACVYFTVCRPSEPAAALRKERAGVRGQEQGEGRHDGPAQQDEGQAGAREQRPQAGQAAAGGASGSTAAARHCAFTPHLHILLFHVCHLLIHHQVTMLFCVPGL